MLFSVIVPIYKVEKYLNVCIESILNQRYKDFELILVDDGSPDHCGAICDEYAKLDLRIKVIHKKNGGLVSARKAGLFAASGEYVFNVDGDDYISENLFWDVAEIVKKYDPGIITFDPVRIVAGKKVFEPKVIEKGLYTKNELNLMKEKLIYNFKMPFFRGVVYPGIIFKAIKRDILLKYQMKVPDKIKIGEDFAVTIPAIFDAYKVYFSNIDGYFYRCHNSSMTRTFDRNAVEDLRNLITYLDTVIDYDKYHTKSQMAAYIINRLFYALVYACRSVQSFAEYKEITEEIDSFFFERMAFYQYSVYDFKLAVISFSIQHRLWRLFWLVYHNKHES